MGSSDNRQQNRRQKAEKRKMLEPLKRKIQQTEKDLASLGSKLEKIDAELSNPDLFRKDAARGEKLSQARAIAARKIETLEEQWLELSGQYDEEL